MVLQGLEDRCLLEDQLVLQDLSTLYHLGDLVLHWPLGPLADQDHLGILLVPVDPWIQKLRLVLRVLMVLETPSDQADQADQ